jgi:acetyl esterase/lipase
VKYWVEWFEGLAFTYESGDTTTLSGPLPDRAALSRLQPWEPTCTLYTKLVESDLPAINVLFPWTAHGFDLLLPPQINPAAQSALYDVDRFLALLANKNGRKGGK